MKCKEWIKGAVRWDMKGCPFTQTAVHVVCGNLWEGGSSVLLKVSFGISIIHERDASDLPKCQEPFFLMSLSEVKSVESSRCLKHVLDQYPVCNSN